MARVTSEISHERGMAACDVPPGHETDLIRTGAPPDARRLRVGITKTARRVSRAIVAALLTLTSVLVIAPTARADDGVYEGRTYCGLVYSGSSPAEDWQAAFNDMASDFYDSLFERAGGPRVLCGAYHQLIEAGAEWVVEKNTPGWLNTLIKAAKAAPAAAGMPAEIPAVGPTTTYPVAWTEDGFLWLRGGPGWGSSLISKIPEGTPLEIICQRHGQWIRSPMSAGDLWDLVEYQGELGLVSDSYVNTRHNGLVARAC